MVFKKKSETKTESEEWNVAKGFSQYKILKHLVDCDRYEIISRYGAYDIDDMIDPKLKIERRIEALKRLKDILKIIIINTNFAIRKEDEETIKKYKDTLIKMDKIISSTFTIKKDSVKKINFMEINEGSFETTLKTLLEIKEGLNNPLNNANLIFRSSEEIDVDDIKSEFIMGG